MKKRTRLYALLLSALMMFSMIPLAAAEEPETIDLSGQTFQEDIELVL